MAGPDNYANRRRGYASHRWQVRLAGLATAVVMVAVVVVSLTAYAGGFSATRTVFVDAPRAGLVMDRDAKVELRGVQVGRVAGISLTGDRALLRLAIDADRMPAIPANVGADIRSTTIFGAKYVNFTVPQQPSPQELRAGTTVPARAVTVEFDTLFQRLTDVLAKVPPQRLAGILMALGTGLQGRGTELGQLIDNGDRFLRDIDASLPELGRDLRSLAQTSDTYADAVPDLLRTTDNAAVSAGTLVAHRDDLTAVLLHVTGLADTGGQVLREDTDPLLTALHLLRPTTELLDEYHSGLYCLIVGLAQAVPIANDIFGGRGPYVTLNASFMPGGEPYQYPKDLPKVNATGGPHCEGVLNRVPGSHANYLVTDTSEGEVWTPELDTHLNGTRVFQLLFAGMPGVNP